MKTGRLPPLTKVSDRINKQNVLTSLRCVLTNHIRENNILNCRYRQDIDNTFALIFPTSGIFRRTLGGQRCICQFCCLLCI